MKTCYGCFSYSTYPVRLHLLSIYGRYIFEEGLKNVWDGGICWVQLMRIAVESHLAPLNLSLGIRLSMPSFSYSVLLGRFHSFCKLSLKPGKKEFSKIEKCVSCALCPGNVHKWSILCTFLTKFLNY
jgi:hypothetical protein